ncbi:hypothetical protein CSKR_108539 [Clonorchis sinensis]|uniref:Uncharacterized protein n=1 Tax=Clonorchis sinensis TaxID=79923 RepID=A0A419QHM1_CLOSI|nr:hypothetical protein CSKR_108539 [Clonorchis sinensis]
MRLTGCTSPANGPHTQFEMTHFNNVTNDRLENANARITQTYWSTLSRRCPGTPGGSSGNLRCTGHSDATDGKSWRLVPTFRMFPRFETPGDATTQPALTFNNNNIIIINNNVYSQLAPSTAFNDPLEQLNLVVDKLQDPETRRAKTIINQLIVQEQIQLCQDSKILHLNPDGGPGTQTWAFVCFVTTPVIEVTAGVQRIAHHITTVVMVNLARRVVMIFRLVPKKAQIYACLPVRIKVSYDVGLDRSKASEHTVSRKPVCVRLFGSKEELTDSPE